MSREEVPEEALDYDEIFRRGSANCGDEDFALCKCPHCGRVYLIEYEVDTLYLDADDLTRRVSILNSDLADFRCVGCGQPFPASDWIGPKAPTAMRVGWEDLAASPWRWVAAQTRE